MYLSGGKGPYLAVDEHTHSHQIGKFFQTAGRVGVEAIVHGGEELQIFSRRKPLVEAAVGSGVKSKLGADLRALAFDVVSGDAGPAARRHQERRQNAQQRGLSGAVGPDQSSNFAGFDLKRDSEQRRMGQRRKWIEKCPHSRLRNREILHEIFNRQGAGCHVLSYTLSVR